MLAPNAEKKVYRLSNVTEGIRRALLDASAKRIWVRAQFIPSAGGRRSGGHCYGELVEYDDTGGTIAKIRAVIWRDEFERITRTLAEHGQAGLLDGQQEICALVAVRFHTVHGLNLQIFDVDPQFGESHLEKNRRRILEVLQRDALLDQNSQLALVTASLRVGLITAPNTAAFADFIATLRNSAFAFRVLFARASMQGSKSAGEVSTAIEALVAGNVDLICIVRGGGSPVELASFDDERLARLVAQCPVPVWVGIGHEIDLTVLDFIAHTTHKTPTAAAEALVSRVRDLDDRLQIARERLWDASLRRLELTDRELQRSLEGLKQGLRKHLQIRDERLRRRVEECRATMADRTSSALQRLAQHRMRLRIQAKNRQMRSSQLLSQRRDGLRQAVARQIERRDDRLRTAGNRLREACSRNLISENRELQRNLDGLQQGLRKFLQIRRERLGRRAERCRAMTSNRSLPAMQRLAQRLALLQSRSRNRLMLAAPSLQRDRDRLRQTLSRLLDRRRERLLQQQQRLDALHPERMLSRGYSITMTALGTIVRNAEDVAAGDIIISRLAQGQIRSIVEETEDG